MTEPELQDLVDRFLAGRPKGVHVICILTDPKTGCTKLSSTLDNEALLDSLLRAVREVCDASAPGADAS